MSNPTAIQMYDYLCKNYYTLPQLVEYTSVDDKKILTLIEHQCIPPHSYEIRNITNFFNAIIEYAVNTPTIRYYHPSLVKWILKAVNLTHQHSLSEVAKLIREEFNKEFNVAFGDESTPGCENLDKAWEYLMNGTWGICLKQLSVEYMAKKQLSRKKIAQIVKGDPEHQLSTQERVELKAAIDLYNSVASDFDPYFVAHSSRRIEIEAAIAKYQL